MILHEEVSQVIADVLRQPGRADALRACLGMGRHEHRHFFRGLAVHATPGSDAAGNGSGAVVGALPFVVPVQFGFAEDGINQRGIRSCAECDDGTQRGIRFRVTAVAGDVSFIE